MARSVRHHVSGIVLLEAFIFILILGGYTFLMVWNIVKIATAPDLDTLKLILTVVGFSVGWILICVFFPFLFWIGPMLIGRRAAKAEDPREIPSDVKSALLHPDVWIVELCVSSSYTLEDNYSEPVEERI